MINADNSIGRNSGGQPAAREAHQPTPASVDFANFLKLLTAQLRHQDPLSPLDSTQFVTQLASFSTVEQLVNANARLDLISQEFTRGDLSSYSNWIGKKAEFAAPIPLDGSAVSFKLAPKPDADQVDVILRDASGKEIFRKSAANEAGVQVWPLPATSGLFTIEAEYFKSGKVSETSRPAILADIVGVRLIEGGAIIRLAGDLEIAADAVTGLGLPE